MTMSLSDLSPRGYVINPDDPRAPATEVWKAMTPEQRARVLADLPSDFTLDFLPPPEGDRHSIPKDAAKDALKRYFRRVQRRVYVGAELAVYYPGERVFAPDVMAAIDVDPHDRDSWVVDAEGKGIDFALEIHVRGDRRKDMKRNVDRYASLGIAEYFVFDRRRGILHGFRLPSIEARVYEPIPSRVGRFESHVLGMELMLESDKIRFLVGNAPVPEADELLTSLGAALDHANSRALALEQELEEEQRLREEAERKLAEALAELERLKRDG